nr:MAG TPA: hypothetical protein [Caudoviricetes sp.]
MIAVLTGVFTIVIMAMVMTANQLRRLLRL